MSLAPGVRLGPYEVIAQLGVGGMGEVWRATDTNLKRAVAIKVLPEAVAADRDRLARFQREAEVLAALNHPNIAHIHGLENSGGTTALVMELVEGPTLADRIARGPLPVDEALAIGRQIAEALEAAHAQGIVHRDLKPANVKVRDDGRVKVLDFGLAKAVAPAGAASDMSRSPTLTSPAMTQMGVILGTAAYMAPEQAKGRPVDKRADIWAFGVVLYEMLAGRRLFRGEDISDTLAEVLKVEIDFRALPASTPASVVRLLRRCLERDPRQRLHDIADARIELDDAVAARPEAPQGLTPPPVAAGAVSARERWLWAAALVGAAAAAAVIARSVGPAVPAPPEVRMQIVTPPSRNPLPVALSPDGRTVAFFGTVDGKTQIWLRPLDAVASRPVPGSDVEQGLFLEWSADGRSLNYSDTGGIKTIDAAGGTARTTSVRTGFGAVWNAGGAMLTAPSNGSAILHIPSSGGRGEPVTEVVSPAIGHRFPAFLPDGRHFLFLATGPVSVQGTYMTAVGSKGAELVGLGDTAAAFMPPDYVVFGRQDALLAQRIELSTGRPIGEPVFIADGVFQNRGVFGSVSLSSSAGTLAYREAVVPSHQLRWMDRTGKEISAVGDIDRSEGDQPPRLSPDGRTILTTRRVNGNTDIWTIDNTAGGTFQRLTTDLATDVGAFWSPDGSRIAFSTSRRGGGFYSLYETTLSRANMDRPLLETPDSVVASDWSRDNRYILFQAQGRQQVARDLWALVPDGSGKPIQITSTPAADETLGRISPDGRWVTYQSNASGTGLEVYVRSFPDAGREWRISTAGGAGPKWRGDGREVYYLDRDSRLMAVSLTLPATGIGVVQHDPPMALFALAPGSTFEPAADGQRFLVNAVLDEAATPPIAVILNWRPPAGTK